MVIWILADPRFMIIACCSTWCTYNALCLIHVVQVALVVSAVASRPITLLSAEPNGPVASNVAAVGNPVFSARSILQETKKPNSARVPKGMDTTKQAFARMDKVQGRKL
jgi:hypothetical protein